jgi:hypothetical protein
MFGKIVAISTIKHLSRNYASFQQPSVQEWYSLSTSGQAQSIPQRNTADFHGDGYILQNTGHEAEEISFVVCDVNSEQKRLQVDFLILEQIFYYKELGLPVQGMADKSCTRLRVLTEDSATER